MMYKFNETDIETISSTYDYLNNDLSSLQEERKLIKNKLLQYLKEKKNQNSSILKEEIDIKINKYNQKFILINSKISKLTREVKKLGALIKSKTKTKKNSKKSSIINHYIEVSDEFANLVGTKKESITSIPLAVKAFWTYIREKNLFDKKTKTIEINDEIRNLLDLKDNEIIEYHRVNSFISNFCTTVEVPKAYSYSVCNGSSTMIHYYAEDY